MENRNSPPLELRSIERVGWLILALAAPACLIAGYAGAAAGLAIGGACALGSFRLMDVYFARVFRKGPGRAGWGHHALYVLRFAALLGAAAAAIGWARLPAAAVAAGLSVPPLAIFIHGARRALGSQGATRA